MAETPSSPTGLRPETIVDVALELISDHGLEWFSMRKLAAALDVNPMTIYLRFDSKDALLDAVARRGLATMELPTETSADASWEDRALALATGLRAQLLGDRNLLELYATSDRMTTAVLRSVEQGLVLMEEIGYRDADAVLAFRSLFWHTVGLAFVDRNPEGFPADRPGGLGEALGGVDSSTHPAFARHLPWFTPVDGDALFTHATRSLVAGLRAAAPHPAPARSDRPRSDHPRSDHPHSDHSRERP